MSKSFTCFLGTAVMLLTIGVVTKITGNPRLAAVSFTLGSISGVFSILLLINSNFFNNLHKFGVAWMVSAASFGVLAYYLKSIEGCGDAALTCAGICALSAISAIGHGVYPTSQRKSSLVTLALDPVLFIAITWIALSGINAPTEMFQAGSVATIEQTTNAVEDVGVADQMANLPQQEFEVMDTMIGITINIFKGNPVKVNGVMPFPHFFLLIHMIWNFFKVMRSYSYWFLGSSIAIPFVIVAWLKHTPKTFGPGVYTMIGISAVVIAVFSISLWKHWRNPATS
jgi:hypothetical protein